MKATVAILMLLFFFVRPSSSQTPKDSIYYKKVAEKGVKFISVYEGKYKVFTQKAGRGKIKLLLLHGGPLNTHEYFENFPEHLKNTGIEIYYYDQLGSFYSDQPDDTSIWNVSRFVDEVEEVRKGLGLKEFFILGHSWGAMLGQLYAAKYPANLKGLILSNVPPEIRDTVKRNAYVLEWRETLHRKVSMLPDFSKTASTRLDSIRRGIKLDYSQQNAFWKALYERKRDSVINREFQCRLDDLPEPLARNIRHINRKQRESSGMMRKIFQADYVAADENITCPVLIIGGAHDRWFPEAYPEMKAQFLRTQVKVYLCPDGSHFSMWDDPANYFPEVIRFLKHVHGKGPDTDN